MNYKCSINKIIIGLCGEEDIDIIKKSIINNNKFSVTDNMVSLRFLTTFQNKNRLFGYFRCKCKKCWTSGISWKNTWQICKKCNTKIYPFNQEELICRKNTKKSTIPHDNKRCGKCIELMHDCTQHSIQTLQTT